MFNGCGACDGNLMTNKYFQDNALGTDAVLAYGLCD
jgi:hypothetical protein